MSDGHDSGSRPGPAERTEGIAESVEEASETLGENLGGLLGGGGAHGGDHASEDHTGEDVERAFESVGQAAGGVAQGATAWHETERAASAARRGDGWGGAAGGLSAAGGTAGHLGGALGALGEATNDEGFRDAARVARSVGAVANLAGSVARHIGDAVRSAEEAGAARSRHVEYELEVDGSEERWTVRAVEITEELSGTYEAVLRIRCEDADVDAVDALLGKDVSLRIDRRGDHDRRLCGIVHRVVEHGAREHHAEVDVHVVPAFALLGHGTDSRIFQEKTAVEIVEEVLAAALGPYRREVDASGLTGAYATREMCVQYRESHRDFVSRLLEEEGIGYYFDCDGDGHERMVLFDANAQLAALRTMDGNPAPFSRGAHVVRGAEPVIRFEPAHRLTATGVTVRDLDWTEPQYRAEATRNGRDLRGRARSIYEHGHGRSVTLQDFSPGGRYGSSDADFQAQIRQELAVRDQHRFTGSSMLIGLRPGVTFELAGHPVPGVDGRYLVLRVRHSSAPPPGAESGAEHGEDYHNVFECISDDQTTYVPDRDTAKPAIYGVQTAVVSGPQPGEPYTDEYGRIKVQFHWDREAVDASRTSAWIRLGQTWAGHDSSGMHTFLFIPRVGSEVIVTFLDGDPDRPLVTGAVYNATNLPPLSLPNEATRSVIRTETIGGGGGHNELSFEDAAGREEVYVRAQRNLHEFVRNDHDTHVLHDHTNLVDGNDTETVGLDQNLTVRQSRWKTVERNESNFIQGERITIVGERGGHDLLRCHHDHRVRVDGAEDRYVIGAHTSRIDGGSTLTVTGGIQQEIVNGGWRMTTTGNVSHTVTGGMVVDTSDGITMDAGANVAIHGATGVEVSGQSITLRSNTSIDYSAPGGINNLTPAAETHVAQSRTEQAMTWHEQFGIKFSWANLALGLYAIKAEYTGVKVDLYGFKADNTNVKAKLHDMELSNAAAVALRRAALTMLG